MSSRQSQRAEAEIGLLLTTALIAVSRAIRTVDTPHAVAYQLRLNRAIPLLLKAAALPAQLAFAQVERAISCGAF